jgi:hypothetical protein
MRFVSDGKTLRDETGAVVYIFVPPPLYGAFEGGIRLGSNESRFCETCTRLDSFCNCN